MTFLVADVGGTNTRIAISGDNGDLSGLERYRNAEFTSFYEVLHRYGASRDLTGITGCCIAVAGPVTSDRAKLTNLGWSFDVRKVAASFANPLSGRVHLVNDLVALGYAVQDLSPSQQSVIRPAEGARIQGSQKLVVGLGTGFNICVVKPTPVGPVVVESELGHASLPTSVTAVLASVLGEGSAGFSTYEHLFSGRGLSRLYRYFADGSEIPGPQVLHCYDPSLNDASARTVALLTRVLGIVTRELVFQYLPYGGIHFAGGVARGLLGSSAKELFLKAFATPGPFNEHVALVPVHLITDDAAALFGAAHFLRVKSQ